MKFRVGDLVRSQPRHDSPVWEFPLVNQGNHPKCVGVLEPNHVALVLEVHDIGGSSYCRLSCADWTGWINDVMLRRVE